jgi:hypothetical protein
MPRPDHDQRIARLSAAARRKSDDASARARRALMALDSRRAPVNFNTVAAEAGVSKDFLYRHEELRTTIMKRRQAGNAAPSIPSGERTTENSAAVKLAVATKALAALRVENKALREENARLLGEVLTQRKAPSVTNHSAPQ